MLTNGKKIWGIWDIALHAFISENDSLVVFDDYNVALTQLSTVYLYVNCEIRVISEGHGSNVPGAYPSNMETKIDYNAQSTTFG